MFYSTETSQLPTRQALLLCLHFTDEEIEIQPKYLITFSNIKKDKSLHHLCKLWKSAI